MGASRKKHGGDINIGMVINTAVMFSRDVMVGIMDYVRQYIQVMPKFFHGSAATSPHNIAGFASHDMDGLIFCGMRKDIVMDFLREMPDHPPVVLCTYSPLSELEFAQLGCGGVVLLDNVMIGRIAADFFLEHGMRNFAFLGNKVYREHIAGEIRCTAFHDRIVERLGALATFRSLDFGNCDLNEDYWDGNVKEFVKFISALPHPCGILANDARGAFETSDVCHALAIKVPDQIEIIGVNNPSGICERAWTSISNIHPDHKRCALESVKMVMDLIENPHLPPDRRYQVISGCKLIERGSTLSRRGYGGIVVRAREYVRLNACKGITVSDVAKNLGVSCRTLEKRIAESMGQSVVQMIRTVRLEKVCQLLTATKLPISEVTLQSGYPLTSNLGLLFKKTYGMSMRQYRNAHHEK